MAIEHILIYLVAKGRTYLPSALAIVKISLGNVKNITPKRIAIIAPIFKAISEVILAFSKSLLDVYKRQILLFQLGL